MKWKFVSDLIAAAGAIIGLQTCAVATHAQPPDASGVIRDDFTGGIETWHTSPDWSLHTSPPGVRVLQANTRGDSFAWKTNVSLGASWAIETTVTLEELFNDGNTTGTVGFALGGTNLNLLLLSDVILSRDNYIYAGAGFWTGQWNDLLENHPWTPGAAKTLTLRLARPPGADNLIFTIKTPSGFRQEFVSRGVPAGIWNEIRRVGLRAFKVKASFSFLSIETPLPPVTSIALYPGITIQGDPGFNYAIQYRAAFDSSSWITLTNVTLSAPQLLWFDADGLTGERRFYRVVRQ